MGGPASAPPAPSSSSHHSTIGFHCPGSLYRTLIFTREVWASVASLDRSCWLDASGPPVPEPDARLDDKRGNRTFSTESEDGVQSRCNTLAGHTKIFLKCRLRADPRAHLEGLNRRPAYPAGRHACGTGNSGPDGRPCPVPCPDTAVAHARHANAGRPADRPHCNTSPGDASVEMASRTPSTSTADAGGCGEGALESARISGDAGHSPREGANSRQVKSRCGTPIPLRDAFYPIPQLIASLPLHGTTQTAINSSHPGSPGSAKLVPSLAATDKQRGDCRARRHPNSWAERTRAWAAS